MTKHSLMMSESNKRYTKQRMLLHNFFFGSYYLTYLINLIITLFNKIISSNIKFNDILVIVLFKLLLV